MWGDTSLWLWFAFPWWLRDVELFLSSCWTFVYFLWKCLFGCSAHFKIRLLGFLYFSYFSCMLSLYVLGISSLSVYDLKIFSPVQSVSDGFLCYLVVFYFCSLTCLLRLCFWCHTPNNHCQDRRQGAVLLYTFFPPEFHGFGSYIKSLTHFWIDSSVHDMR